MKHPYLQPGGMIAFRDLVVPAEDEKLINAFGEEYLKFQNRTGALVPKF